MTRIKYDKGNDCLLGTDWLPAGPNLLLAATINSSNYCWVIDNQDNKPVANGEAYSLRAAKSQVRKKLIELGLKLEDEIRRSTPKSGTIN